MAEPLRVLIVDDQPRARQALRALLATWNRAGEIHEAANGCEAVQMVPVAAPDLILMDARMPELDGVEATRQIKARGGQITVIVLSLYPEYRAAALAAGADAFLPKGQSPADLLATIEKVTYSSTVGTSSSEASPSRKA
jgi:CheY-like chemotaxis protein